MDKEKKKIKIEWIVVGIILLLVAFGIYNKTDKQVTKDAELQDMNSALVEVVQAAQENQVCFEDESLQQNQSAECVIKLRQIQDIFRTTDKKNVTKLEAYYNKNKSVLDEKTKEMIENSLRLYKSESYSDLMSAYDQFFSAYIEWHKYFRDYVGIRGVDNLSEDEIMQAKYLAEDVVEAEKNLELKKNAFNDYMHKNFDRELIDALTNYAESLKE
jgi:allophanate hydrolase subunit 1